MKSANKEKFIKLIKTAEPQKPAVDLTTRIMDEISADLQNEIAINPKLKTLLHQQAIEKAPEYITDNVMFQIQSIGQKKGYVPLISNKTWSLIAAGIVIMFVALTSSVRNAPGSAQQETDYVGNLIHTFPSIYLVVIMMFSVLLYLDYLINTRVSISTKG